MVIYWIDFDDHLLAFRIEFGSKKWIRNASNETSLFASELLMYVCSRVATVWSVNEKEKWSANNHVSKIAVDKFDRSELDSKKKKKRRKQFDEHLCCNSHVCHKAIYECYWMKIFVYMLKYQNRFRLWLNRIDRHLFCSPSRSLSAHSYLISHISFTVPKRMRFFPFACTYHCCSSPWCDKMHQIYGILYCICTRSEFDCLTSIGNRLRFDFCAHISFCISLCSFEDRVSKNGRLTNNAEKGI